MPAQIQSVRVDYVVHIGTGAAAAAAGYGAQGLDPIILAPFGPQDLDRFTGQTGPLQTAPALHQSVTAQGGVRTFHLLNDPVLTSTAPPLPALFGLFPGARLQGTCAVETQSIVDLLKQYALPEARRGMLVLETPGQEGAILRALQEAQYLDRFHILRIQVGRDALYDGAMDSAQMRQALTELGFAVWEEDAPDPARPYLLGRYDVQMERVQTELALCQADLAALKKRYRALLEDADTLEPLLQRLSDQFGNMPDPAAPDAQRPEAE